MGVFSRILSFYFDQFKFQFNCYSYIGVVYGYKLESKSNRAKLKQLTMWRKIGTPPHMTWSDWAKVETIHSRVWVRDRSTLYCVKFQRSTVHCSTTSYARRTASSYSVDLRFIVRLYHYSQLHTEAYPADMGQSDWREDSHSSSSNSLVVKHFIRLKINACMSHREFLGLEKSDITGMARFSVCVHRRNRIDYFLLVITGLSAR